MSIVKIIVNFAIILIPVSLLIIFLRWWLKKLNISPQGTDAIIISIMISTLLLQNNWSKEQTRTLKSSTQNYINTMQEFNTKSKVALLSALVLEHKSNIRIMKDIVAREKEYTDMNSDAICLSKFSTEAYQANLFNATIDDSTLLNEIVQLYSVIKTLQNSLDKINLSTLRTTKIENAREVIKNIKENEKQMEETLNKIIQYNKVIKKISK